MAKCLIYLGLALMMVVGSSAFFFNRRATAQATEDVDQNCIELARQGSCDFYECFERRLPCGRDWYILRLGQYYCNKIQRQKDEFSPAGQSFLDDSTRCLTTALIDAYQQDIVDCHALKHQATSSISTCYIENAFCNVFNENADQFSSIYEAGDLFSRGAAGIWREIVTMATRCGGEAVRRLTATASQSITGVAQNAWESISSIFQDN